MDERNVKQEIMDNIWKKYPTYSDLKKASVNQLTGLRGVGRVTATEIKDYVQEMMKLNTSQHYHLDRF